MEKEVEKQCFKPKIGGQTLVMMKDWPQPRMKAHA